MRKITEQFKSFAKRKSLGVIPFYTIGFPTEEVTKELVFEAEKCGALAVELGIPFTDPIADGPIIQEASQIALRQGVNLASSLALCDDLRRDGLKIPLILMTYYNPIHVFGTSKFCQYASKAGVDGLIVSDLPFEESSNLREHCLTSGIDYIPLVPPNCSGQRMSLTCSVSSGFVYCVSLTGVTGPRDALPEEMFDFLGRVRRTTDVPIAVGFGISKPDHIQQLKGKVDAVIVGSALVRMLQSSEKREQVQETSLFLGKLIAEAETNH